MATVSSLEELLSVIADIQAFHVADGVLLERQRPGNNQEPVRLVINDLAVIDPRIPFAVEALSSVTRDRTANALGNILYANFFKDTLRFWIEPTWLHTVSAERILYRWLVAFNTVDLNPEATKVSIRTWTSVVTTVSCTSIEPFDIVTGTVPVDYETCPRWLDVTFPGWRTRYNNAFTLGYTGYELLYHTLNYIPATTTVNLASLTFT